MRFLSVEEPKTQSLLVKFLSVKEGIDFLLAGNEREMLFNYDVNTNDDTGRDNNYNNSSSSHDQQQGDMKGKNWLLDALNAWKDRRCCDYVDQIDSLITNAFAECDNKINPLTRFQALRSSSSSIFAPIQIQTKSFLDDVSSLNIIGSSSARDSETMMLSSSSSSTQQKNTTNTTRSSTSSGGISSNSSSSSSSSSASAAAVESSEYHGSNNNHDQSWYNSDPNKHLVTDLHGLTRVPWNIEVRSCHHNCCHLSIIIYYLTSPF